MVNKVEQVTIIITCMTGLFQDHNIMISGLTEEMVNKVEQVTIIITCMSHLFQDHIHYDISDPDRRNGEQGGAGYYYNNVFVSSLSGSQHYDIRIDRRNGEQGGASYYYNKCMSHLFQDHIHYDISDPDRRNGEQGGAGYYYNNVLHLVLICFRITTL